MKKYYEPYIQIRQADAEDIISTSGDNPDLRGDADGSDALSPFRDGDWEDWLNN